VEQVQQESIVLFGLEVVRQDSVEAGLEDDVVVASDHTDVGDLVPGVEEEGERGREEEEGERGREEEEGERGREEEDGERERERRKVKGKKKKNENDETKKKTLLFLTSTAARVSSGSRP